MLLDADTRVAEEAVRGERPVPVPTEPFPAITGARLPALTEIDLQPDRKPPATTQRPQPIPEEPKPPR